MFKNLTIHDWISIGNSILDILLIFMIIRWNYLIIKLGKMKSKKNENQEYEND